jgi:hypothetical protein
MLEILMVIAAVLAGAGLAVFLLFAALDVVLYLKLRSMFDRGAPFVGY